MSFRPLMIAAALAVALLLCLSAAPARACCVYNDASLPLLAQSQLQGMTKWVLPPGEHRCTEGTGGKKVDLWLLGPDAQDPVSTMGTLLVSPEGWIRVGAKKDGKWKAVSHTGEGKPGATVQLLPRGGLSGGQAK
ncbi:MAG: hypothetical protein K9K66_16000 [Desulfarculaceae bacterium]|nr:hypothetical protein [Desulfarculaceae bacterium]MCF8073610.1 hypothetical protein [Desulfarculaceae bacterium]MCF8103158.1 hypothetical protein [Desulfarculaceae bacterium]MCF8115674.1 hypothetical protein [Desulfarculaceae bacterium]